MMIERLESRCLLALPADFNGDGAVDSLDFAIIAGNFAKPADHAHGDADGNGKCDTLDFNQLAVEFGQRATAYDFVIKPGQSIGSVHPSPGQRVDILAGTYGAFSFPTSGVVGNQIHYNFESGAIVDGGVGNVIVSGGTYLDITGMVVQHARNGLQATNAAVKIDTGTSLTDCTIQDIDAVGLAVFGHDVTLTRVTMQRCGEEGLTTQTAANVLIKDCKIFNCDRGVASPSWAGKANTFLENGLWFVDSGWEAGAMKLWTSDHVTIDGLESAFNRGPQGWNDYKNTNQVVENSYFHDAIGSNGSAVGWRCELGETGPYTFTNNRFVNTGWGINMDAVSNVTCTGNTFTGGTAYFLQPDDSRGGLFNILATGDIFVGAVKYYFSRYGTVRAGNVVIDGTKLA